MKRSFIKYLALGLSLCTSLLTNAAIIDTATTFSPSMKKNIKAVVIKPDSYAKATQLPVIYLLHGHGGNYADWIRKVPALARYADQLNVIVVCPDGNVNSWYWDSPIDSSSKYETYVSTELVQWIDEHYKTIRNRRGRGITGLSMGGHGALYLALRHQQVFGAAGSMSGGVDIRPFPLNWQMASYLGTYATHPDNWERYTVINNTHLLTRNSLAIMIDCGTDDFFYAVNNKLHEKLLYNNIPHDYLVRPGAHDWNYWSNAVHYQLLFMSHFFNNE